jgi:hypothetical protein
MINARTCAVDALQLPYLDMPFKVTLAKKLLGIALVIPVLSLLLFVRAFLWERNLRNGRQHDPAKDSDEQLKRNHDHGHHDHAKDCERGDAPSLWSEAKDAFFSALPIIVWLSFFLSVPISSFAFLALRACDCVYITFGSSMESNSSDFTQMCFLHADYSVFCPPTLNMTAAETLLYHKTMDYAWFTVLVYAVGTPVTFAWMLFTARKAIRSSADTRLSLALSFLYREYRNGLWFWELLISITKLILVGFLSLSVFHPGTPMQIMIALAVTLCARFPIPMCKYPRAPLQLHTFADRPRPLWSSVLAVYTALVSWVQPYRNKGLGFLAVFSSASLQFIFLTFLSLMLYSGASHSIDAVLYTDPSHRLVKTVFGVGELFICALGVLVVAIFVKHVIWTKARTVHWSSDDEEVRVRQPRGGKHHIFLSHAWRSGQDQAKAVKLLLIDVLPELKVFLDVDSALDRDRSEGNKWMFLNVRKSTTLVALLTGEDKGKRPTSHYFMSEACVLEMRTAIDEKKNIVLVIETDSLHGGVPLTVHKKDCKRNNRAVHDALFESMSADFVSPTIVEWHRYVELQQVSTRLVLQSVLQSEEPNRRKDDTIWTNGDITRQRLHLHQPSGHHLFVSENLPGATAFASYLSNQIANRRVGVSSRHGLGHGLLQRMGSGGGHHHLRDPPGLTKTSKLDEMHGAGFFLLYVNEDTWTDVDMSDVNGLTWRSIGTEPPRGHELKISSQLRDIFLERTANDEQTVIFTREELPHHEIYTRDCNHYIVDRRGRCFMPLGNGIADEITLSRALAVPILVVHEMRQHGEWHGTPTFTTIYNATPEELRNRLYSTIAIPMLDGRPDAFSPGHELTCVNVILRSICKDKDRWQKRVQRWAKKKRAQATLYVEPLLPQAPLRVIREASGHLSRAKGAQPSDNGAAEEQNEQESTRQRMPTLPSRFAEFGRRETVAADIGASVGGRKSMSERRRSSSNSWAFLSQSSGIGESSQPDSSRRSGMISPSHRKSDATHDKGEKRSSCSLRSAHAARPKRGSIPEIHSPSLLEQGASTRIEEESGMPGSASAI